MQRRRSRDPLRRVRGRAVLGHNAVKHAVGDKEHVILFVIDRLGRKVEIDLPLCIGVDVGGVVVGRQTRENHGRVRLQAGDLDAGGVFALRGRRADERECVATDGIVSDVDVSAGDDRIINAAHGSHRAAERDDVAAGDRDGLVLEFIIHAVADADCRASPVVARGAAIGEKPAVAADLEIRDAGHLDRGAIFSRFEGVGAGEPDARRHIRRNGERRAAVRLGLEAEI